MIDAIAWLNKYGHFANPAKAEALNVTDRDIPRLSLTDTPVIQAAQSIQELDLNYERLGEIMLGRKPEVDGVIGPVTLALMAIPRCACIDYARDEASGSWPESCRKALKVHIDTSNAPSWMDVDAIFQWSVKRYAEVGVGLERTESVNEAHIRQSFRGGRGWIGLAEFNSGHCSDDVFNYRDPRYNGGEIQNKNLDLHELGHNMNLQHTRGDIMNPSISAASPYWVRWDSSGNIVHQDNSYRTLKRYFPGPPLGEPPKPDPPKPPPEPPEPDPPKPEPPTPEPPMGDIFNIILEAVIEIIKNGDFCSRERVRQPRLLDRLRVQRAVRDKLGMDRREWRKNRAEVQEHIDAAIADMTDEDADYLIDLAKAEADD